MAFALERREPTYASRSSPVSRTLQYYSLYPKPPARAILCIVPPVCNLRQLLNPMTLLLNKPNTLRVPWAAFLGP